MNAFIHEDFSFHLNWSWRYLNLVGRLCKYFCTATISGAAIDGCSAPYFSAMTKFHFEKNCSYFEHVIKAKGSPKWQWWPTIIEIRKTGQSIQHRRCCENGESDWDKRQQSWHAWMSFLLNRDTNSDIYSSFLLHKCCTANIFAGHPPTEASTRSGTACLLPWEGCERSSAPLPCPNSQGEGPTKGEASKRRWWRIVDCWL